MAVMEKVVDAGAKAGKKVLETDAAQSLVGTVVDKLERIVKEQTDEVGEDVKSRAAKAGGRSAKSTSRKKTSGRKKTTTRKKTAARSPSSRKTSARGPSTRKKTSTRKPSSRRKTSARKR